MEEQIILENPEEKERHGVDQRQFLIALSSAVLGAIAGRMSAPAVPRDEIDSLGEDYDKLALEINELEVKVVLDHAEISKEKHTKYLSDVSSLRARLRTLQRRDVHLVKEGKNHELLVKLITIANILSASEYRWKRNGQEKSSPPPEEYTQAERPLSA